MDFAALQHSVFLEALGSAILNSLWQCFILWLIYETISVSYKSASARFKNNLSTLLLFFSFAWFLTSFISKILNQQNVSSFIAVPSNFATGSQSTIHAVSAFKIILSYASAFLSYLSVAYIFLLFFLIARLFAAYRYVYIVSNKLLINPKAELQLFASKVAGEIGITKKISVWISHYIDVPATVGFIKPVILIPFASVNNLSCHQLEAIILHELAHIKRNDYITNLLISVIETILFFNPFVVLLSNVIKRERENCCDDFVLQYRYDPHSYASALLRLEQSRLSNLRLAISAVSGRKQLLLRIKRITNSKVVSRQFNYGQKLIALLLATTFICSVAWLSPKEKKSVTTKVPTKQIKPTSLSKITTIDKVEPEEVMVAKKQNENLPVISTKHISPINEQANLAETDAENLSTKDFPDEDDERKDNPDFFTVEHNTYTEAVNLKQPSFFFNENNLKLPPFINIQNFPFQNMNLNIDLSKINMIKLDENLKQAYKQINALDWNKIQNEIRKSFPKMKFGNSSQKNRDAFYSEKAKAISKINITYPDKLNSKAFSQQVKNEMLEHNSLRTAEMALLNATNSKIQQVRQQIQKQYERNTGSNYHFSYSNTEDAADVDEEPKTECPQKNIAALNSLKKNIKISVKRIPNHTRVLNEKNSLQFYFDRDDDKSNHENVINVEVTNLP
ncbi:MAG: M56 family metallopeptidase [Ginsengibacter sp.]